MICFQCATLKISHQDWRATLRHVVRHLFTVGGAENLEKQTYGRISHLDCATCATSAPITHLKVQVVVNAYVLTTMSKSWLGNTTGGAAALTKFLWDVGKRWRRWRNPLRRHPETPSKSQGDRHDDQGY